jgi:hypothetical protein
VFILPAQAHLEGIGRSNLAKVLLEKLQVGSICRLGSSGDVGGSAEPELSSVLGKSVQIGKAGALGRQAGALGRRAGPLGRQCHSRASEESGSSKRETHGEEGEVVSEESTGVNKLRAPNATSRGDTVTCRSIYTS